MSSGSDRGLDNDGYFEESILPPKVAMSNVELLYKMMLTLAFKLGIFLSSRLFLAAQDHGTPHVFARNG
jgi:hypothetical protein